MTDQDVIVKYGVEGANEAAKQTSALEKGLNKLKASFTTVAVAAAGLIATFKNFYDEAARQVAVQKQTEQVIKSTGYAAGLTAKEIGKMADQLSRNSNMTDDAIQTGQNMLLTFTNIGRDVFPQATKTMMDMATAMSGGVTPTAESLKTTAIQLGKALNNPAEGATALRRVGVALTDQQIEQIKTFQKANNIAGAQAVVLKELGVEFGGLSEAMADPVEQAGNAFKEFQERTGMLLREVAVPFARWVLWLKDGFDQLSPSTQKIIGVMTLLGIAAMALIPIVASLGLAMTAATLGIPAAIALIVSGVIFLSNAFKNADQQTGLFGDTIRKIKEIFEKIVDTLRPLLDAFIKLASAIWEIDKAIFSGILNAFKQLFSFLEKIGVIDAFKSAWTNAFEFIGNSMSFVQEMLQKLAAGIEWLASKIAGLTGKKVTVEQENKQTGAGGGSPLKEGAIEAMNEQINAEEDAKTELMLQKSAERKALLDEQQLAMRGMDAETKAEWDAIDNEQELLKFEEKMAKLNENNELTLQQEAMFEERRRLMKAANYQQDFSTWLGVEKLKLVNKQSTAQQMDTWENFMLQGTKSKNKEVAAMAKALAIKNIIFTTAQSAMSAFNALAAIPIVGPALGFAAAGLAIAFGAEQISAVNSQSTELAEGGSMIVDQPTQIGGNVIAGEAGPERIDVTPLDQQAPQIINNYLILDGDTLELVSTKVAKINQQSRTEGTLDDSL